MTLNDIQEIIENAVPDSKAYILDPMNDGQHLQAFVISPVFDKMLLVKQHQMVMTPLKQAFAQSVHALALKTFTPEKWANEKSNYGY